MSYIVVTGGTSKIGEEIIYKLSRNSDIIFTYNKSKSKIDEIKKKFKKISTNKIFSFKLNLENQNEIQKFYKFLIKKKIKIKSFVHNAFIDFSRKNFLNIKKDNVKKYIMANCFGSFLLTQLVTKLIIKSIINDKSLIFISSQSAEYGGFELSAYSASKGFLNSLSNSLSKELGKNQIRSNVISLGKFETDNFMKNYNWNKKSMISDIPFGYIGKPKYVSEIVNNLIFKSPYLSGANIKLSGGR